MYSQLQACFFFSPGSFSLAIQAGFSATFSTKEVSFFILIQDEILAFPTAVAITTTVIVPVICSLLISNYNFVKCAFVDY